MLTRAQMERHQIGLYILTLIAAAICGLFATRAVHALDHPALFSVMIALLMYGMFTQIPFITIKQALINRRFVAAILIANYVAVPLIVWLLCHLLPQETPLLLGVYLVLLTPCIDYVIVFTYLGRGNEKLMLLSTPVLFITQMLLLPLYLWLFLGIEVMQIVEPAPFIQAFLIVIVLPLMLAITLQWITRRNQTYQVWLDRSAWLPVPMMALTLFVIVSSQIGKLTAHWALIVAVIPVYIAFMLIMPWIARTIAYCFKLDIAASRTVIFSSSTRNSLVVLPLALSLPNQWSVIVAAIIVTQTIVELAGELVYVRLVPGFILRDMK
ncbi:arsenic resistance protein [Paenibacillus sp. SGZ-1009]|uniref:arsenic resistance protein n=1 Tax=Paenibacillus campi TaxID=3106031 RepID=UPI002AFDD94D|nr:bile acid:sodium symporter [Paenibacillus sp. SGZ-1009]